jgi:hypothetical protein
MNMNTTVSHHSCNCGCCAGHPGLTVNTSGVSRRHFLYHVGALTAGGFVLASLDLRAADAAPLLARPPRLKRPLKVQPVLTYEVPQRREATSWRSWGGIQTEEQAAQEKNKIAAELEKLQAKADFPLEILPVTMARNPQQAGAIANGDFDTLLLYAAGGWVETLQTLVKKDRSTLMFLRHDPGPVYLWYEIVHPRLLRKTVDEYDPIGMDVHDVVVDNYDEVLWRLRALAGLKNTLGKRIIAIGGVAGWGAGGQQAPGISKNLWKLDMIDYPYGKLEPRLKEAFAKPALVKSCERAAGEYLQQAGISLQTTREFVNNAFVLCEVLKDVMDEAQTDAITINSCMGTIMPMSKTTACLPLSMLNDEGYLAFCESDFVVIPSGILLHYISSKPVFLNDPTYPHDGVVTLAHCTAPRRMDGNKAEPAKILTHFESDYGAAPKVEMKIGQICTNLVPDFACKKWVGFEGTIVGNPFLDICRSQIDMRINGDAMALLEQMKGFHWMMSYGNYLRECSYALKKLGVELLNVSPARTAA